MSRTRHRRLFLLDRGGLDDRQIKPGSNNRGCERWNYRLIIWSSVTLGRVGAVKNPGDDLCGPVIDAAVTEPSGTTVAAAVTNYR